ncbi:hypothetical protein GCM10027174_26440 [Salinifilum aidingensis]
MSQPGSLAQPNAPQSDTPGTLDQAEQQRLIQEIGRLVVHALPPGWQETRVEYRAAGVHDEVSAVLVAPNGTQVPLAAPVDVKRLFVRLREGMYQPERGTWVSALYRLQRPGSYAVDFNGDHEPQWQNPPPPQAYVDELRMFPRPAESTPDWLARRGGAPGGGSAGAHPALRTAEVFDGTGRPITAHPAVPPAEREPLLNYLDSAPAVVPARDTDADRLAPERGPVVPLSFHTDGTWVWPAAAPYYLREHDVAPEPELVEHARRNGFRPPEVDPTAREEAVALITGERAR